MWSEMIYPEAPYDVERLFGRVSMDPLQYIEFENRLLKVPLVLNQGEAVVSVQSQGTKERPAFEVRGEEISTKDEVISRIRAMYDFDMKPRDILGTLDSTTIGELVEQYAGMPIICEPSTYCTLLKNIVHQQLNMKFAYTLTYRFVTRYGREKDGVWFYPDAEVVSNLTVEELRELQFSNRKAEYVIGVARRMVNGELNMDELTELSNEDAYKKLLPIRGVGPWTVECVLLFGLGRKDILPAGDVGIQNAIKKWFNLTSKPTKEELYAYHEKWSPYSSYVSMYLWESLSE
ncbi:DNA-3-methyladenine glycosylase family protein [Guptibacillus hwajinpoensis]|uniref:DNA-3-methyladenine glycosylase II n=2 Tax=Guptibacillus hwajinpoensis TaxID=208199 RepID=A0A0J6FNE7_9BACL|nr:DNA-3-methyladenine glycosylase [Alkalihalobacillus macyae]KMM35897.1 hypothetical protein AB986_20845 [Alkalihalobacillus macyae]